jgi:hypothetical protein
VTNNWVCLPLACFALFCASSANAQSAFDVNLGFGTAHDSASGGGLDNASSLNAFGTCTPGSGDPFCQTTPSLSGFFLGFGADLMLFRHFGVGGEFNVTPARSNYGPLQYRQLFYDMNAIYAPLSAKRAALQLQGGIGGARTSFAFSQSSCVGTAVCSTAVEPVGNASHFQIHAGVGVQIYLTDHIFIRPQFDVHYVPNLTEQFGSNFVPEGTIWVGYNFGEH